MSLESVRQELVGGGERLETQTASRRLAGLWRADFCSPKDFIRRALFLTVVFLVVHLAGLKEFTSILNGTTGSMKFAWGTSAFFGMTYIFSYLAFVLLVPILLLAAALLAAWKRLAHRQG